MATQQSPAAEKPNLANIFSGINDAKRQRQRGTWLTPGHYWSRLDNVVFFTGRDGTQYFKIEHTIIKVLDNANGIARPVGENITEMYQRQGNDYFLSEVNSFIGGVLSLPADSITPDNVIAIVTEDGDNPQPLRNWIVEIKANYKPKKKDAKEGDPLWVAINYKREVPPSEALGVLDEAAKQRFFPNQMLEGFVKTLAENTAAAAK